MTFGLEILIYCIGFVVILFMGVKIKKEQLLYMRQTAYDAVSYAHEFSEAYEKMFGIKMNPEQKLDYAVHYMQQQFGLMSRKEAERQCISILGKTYAVGATGIKKI